MAGADDGHARCLGIEQGDGRIAFAIAVGCVAAGLEEEVEGLQKVVKFAERRKIQKLYLLFELVMADVVLEAGVEVGIHHFAGEGELHVWGLPEGAVEGDEAVHLALFGGNGGGLKDAERGCGVGFSFPKGDV